MSPIYGYAYRNYLLETAEEIHEVSYDSNFIFQFPMFDNNARWGKYFPYVNLVSSENAIRTKTFNADSTEFPDLGVILAPNFLTRSEEIYWSSYAKIHLINAPRMQSITGDITNYTGDHLDYLKLISASAEGVLTWMSLDEVELKQTEYSILGINSRIQNSGMGWDGDETVHNQWGGSPTQILPLKVTLHLDIDADSIHIFPLDNRGKESTFFTVYPLSSGVFEVHIDQKSHASPWFGIQAFKGATPVHEEAHRLQVSFFPNPVDQDISIMVNLENKSSMQIDIMGVGGKLLKRWEQGVLLPGSHAFVYPVRHLVPGMYMVRLVADNQTWLGKFIKK
jgi:hypothetical protein